MRSTLVFANAVFYNSQNEISITGALMRSGADETSANHIKEFEEFVQLAKKDKAGHRLHSEVEKRLQQLLSLLYPDECAVSEVGGVLGGRNDLMQFSFNGRRAVFELFFSPSQVPQDLRLLELANADIKIAILLDREINPKLAEEYFHKKPDHFPYLWLSFLMVSSRERFCLARLRELVDEDASVRRLRRILSSSAGSLVEERLRKNLEKVETFLSQKAVNNAHQPAQTIGQVAALRIIAKIQKMGIPLSRLSLLYTWLEQGIGFAFTLVGCGFQAFLITDFEQTFAIESDADLADDLFAGAEDGDRVYLVVCVNKIINGLLEENGTEKRPLAWHFFHTYEENIGKLIPAWELNNTNIDNERDADGEEDSLQT